MAYKMIEDYTLNFTGGPMTPKGFAIHWWGDPTQRPTFDAILRVLIQAAEVERASVNFMAEAGKVACLVDPFTIAWGQGDGATGWGNNNLVSIECNPRCTAADRETVAELIADQHIKNGIPIVLYPHNKFTATQCPGVWEQYLPWLTTRAKQIVEEKTNKVIVKEEEMPLTDADVKKIWGLKGSKKGKTIWSDVVDTYNLVTQQSATIAGLTKALSVGSDLTEEQITSAVREAFAGYRLDLVKDTE